MRFLAAVSTAGWPLTEEIFVNRLTLYILSAVFFLIGAFLISGTILGWRVVVDPDEDNYRRNGLAFIKKVFGSGCLVSFNLVIGGLLIIVSIITLVDGLTGALTVAKP
jgi:hypothetical protein